MADHHYSLPVPVRRSTLLSPCFKIRSIISRYLAHGNSVDSWARLRRAAGGERLNVLVARLNARASVVGSAIRAGGSRCSPARHFLGASAGLAACGHEPGAPSDKALLSGRSPQFSRSSRRPTDLPARLLTQILPKLGQPWWLENRVGAGGAIGARAVAVLRLTPYAAARTPACSAIIPAVSAGAVTGLANFAPCAKISKATRSSWCIRPQPMDIVTEFSPTEGKPVQVQNDRAYAPAACRHRTAVTVSAASHGATSSRGLQRRRRGPLTSLLGSQVHCTFEATRSLPQSQGKLRCSWRHHPRTRTQLAPEIPTMIEAAFRL